jgi:ATP-dependent Clp protease protease subunit
MDIYQMDSEKAAGKSKNFKERIQEQFLSNRQIFLWGAVTYKSSEDVIEKMMYLESKEPGKPIYFFINSPGGVISSGMAVYDIMSMISSPVYTVTMGMAASMGALLFSAGEKGHRYMFSHARVMIHQPLISGQIVAPAIDIKIHAEEIKKTKNELNRILAENTSKTMDQIEKDTDRDYWMNADEAIKYGIADHLLDSFSVLNTVSAGKSSPKPSPKTSAAGKKSSKPKSSK